MKKILFIAWLITCIVVNGFYAYVLFAAPEKLEDKTFYVGAQSVTLEDGSTESRNFLEIKYFSNRNGNGYENLDIKFNYLLDENKTGFMSQGLQYSAKTMSGKIDFSPALKMIHEQTTAYKSVKAATLRYNDYYKAKVTSTSTPGVNTYNYMSDDNEYSVPMHSTNPLTSESFFKIEIGSDVYNMRLRYDDFDYGNSNTASNNYAGLSFSGVTNWNFIIAHSKLYENYRCYDLNYFAENLYNAVKDIPGGVSTNKMIEFGNLFDYYKMNNSTGISQTKEKDEALTKVLNNFRSYYTIKVTVTDDGLRRAEDSLFNSFQGNANYNTMPDLNTDYYWGRAIIEVDMDDLELKETAIVGEYIVTLNKLFVESFIDSKNSIKLDIVIDLDYLDTLNIKFVGIEKESFKNFSILEITTTQTIDGKLIETEVNYA